MWHSFLNGFKAYLKLEKSLSENSVNAYLHDIEKLKQFALAHEMDKTPAKLTLKELKEFVVWCSQLGMSARTQARVISGIKAFYKYMLMEELIEASPAELLETPKIGRKLPEVLAKEEIDLLIAAIDLSKAEGERNRAILETLYGCGLRVSELTNLKISNLHFDMGFVKVEGKGNKERLVPIGSFAQKYIEIYLKQVRVHQDIQKGSEDILFLNRRGKQLTRVMIYTIIQQLVQKIGLEKKISPHTFRHSFASHLIDGGADLRAVQDMLGHESITTTEIYTHLDRGYLRDAILHYHPREMDGSIY